MRRVVLLTLLTLACVGSGAGAAAPGDPQKRIVPADQAKARSVNITRADLGQGWKAETPDPRVGDDFRCSIYNPDESDLTLTGEAESADLSYVQPSELLFVKSAVSVYKSVAQLNASWQRTVRPGFARCFAEAISAGIAEGGGKGAFKASSQGKLAFPRIAPQTAAFRVVGRMTANGATLPVTVDLVAVGRDRAVALIFVVSVVQAPDAAGERALARLVAARLAKAFPGGGAGGVSA